MIKLGVIGAMAVEVETLRAHMTGGTAVNRAGMEFFEGNLEGVRAVVVVCGVGKVNAAMCAQILCCCFGVTHIINTGVAGSLSPELDIGDFVISRDAVYHDFDCHTLDPDYPMGQVPGLPVWSFPASEQLIMWAKDALERVYPGHGRVGTVASGDQFVCEWDRKSAIVSQTGALCTEMEGAAIAHTAWRNGVPFLVIRAISDKADNSAQMDYPAFEAQAASRSAAVTLAMVGKMKEAGLN